MSWENKKNYRPGVYSEYDIKGGSGQRGGRHTFYCGGAKLLEGSSLKAGGVVRMTSLDQLKSYFTPDGGGGDFYSACRLLLQSGVPDVYAVPITTDGAAASLEGYKAAFGKLGEVKGGGIVTCGSTTAEVLKALLEMVSACSASQKERVAVAAAEATTAVTIAAENNSERLVLCCQKAKTAENGDTQSSLLSAAALAGRLAMMEAGENLNGRELRLLTEVEALPEARLEELMKGGVTVLEGGESGVECIRAVTTRTTTAGEVDRTFAAVNVVMMIDDIIQTVRARLWGMMKGAASGSFTLDSIASQTAVILAEKREAGLIANFEPPVAYPDSSDPQVCTVEIEFRLTAVASQIYLTAHIAV